MSLASYSNSHVPPETIPVILSLDACISSSSLTKRWGLLDNFILLGSTPPIFKCCYQVTLPNICRILQDSQNLFESGLNWKSNVMLLLVVASVGKQVKDSCTMTSKIWPCLKTWALPYSLCCFPTLYTCCISGSQYVPFPSFH